MSLYPNNPFNANYINNPVVYQTTDIDTYNTIQDGNSLKIENLTTGGYVEISSSGIDLTNDGITVYNVNLIDIVALETPPNTTTLKVNDTIEIDNGIETNIITPNGINASTTGNFELISAGSISLVPNGIGGTTNIQNALFNTPLNINGYALENCNTINTPSGFALNDTGGSISLNSNGIIELNAGVINQVDNATASNMDISYGSRIQMRYNDDPRGIDIYNNKNSEPYIEMYSSDTITQEYSLYEPTQIGFYEGNTNTTLSLLTGTNLTFTDNVASSIISSSSGNLVCEGGGTASLVAFNDLTLTSFSGNILLNPNNSVASVYSGSIGYDANVGGRETLTINTNTSNDFNMLFNCKGSYYFNSESVGNENLILNLSGVGNGTTGKIGCVDIGGNQYLNVEAETGKGLILNGLQINLDTTTIDLQNTSTTTSTSNHNAHIRSTSNGLDTTHFLKVKLNGNDIWIPYFTTDPSL